MSKLSELRTKRGQQKTARTRIKNYVEGLDLEHLNQKAVFEIKARLDKLHKINENFEEFQDNIEVLLELEGKTEDHDYKAEFEEIFYSLYAEMENILQNFSDSNSKSPQDKNNSVKGVISTKRVKLPTIELPTFNGDYKNWITYRDLFKSLMHNQIHLSKTEKFYYLKASLKGEAFSLIDPCGEHMNS